MIILTAGHTGPNSGAQCAATQFDEGAENIWLRNRIAEILTNKYGLVVLMDDDRASLKLLTQALSDDLSHTECTENTEDAVAFFALRLKTVGSPAEDSISDVLSPTDDTDNSDINSSFSLMRSLASQEIALQIDTDFTPSECLSHTKNISHTELTENTEDAVAAPAILSPTDDTDNSDINSSFSSMRSLAAQEVALQIDTDFTPSECLSLTDDGLQSTDLTPPPYRHLPYKQGRNHENAQHLKILPLFIGGTDVGVSADPSLLEICRATRRSLKAIPEGGGGSIVDDFVIDLHFNAHSNPNARGTEAIVSDDATTLELRFATRLAHATADALDIPLRCIKSESQTPHRRLGMLHLTPQSVILEVCFCTSPEDVEAYRKNREKLAADLAWAIYELL